MNGVNESGHPQPQTSRSRLSDKERYLLEYRFQDSFRNQMGKAVETRALNAHCAETEVDIPTAR